MAGSRYDNPHRYARHLADGGPEYMDATVGLERHNVHQQEDLRRRAQALYSVPQQQPRGVQVIQPKSVAAYHQQAPPAQTVAYQQQAPPEQAALVGAGAWVAVFIFLVGVLVVATAVLRGLDSMLIKL